MTELFADKQEEWKTVDEDPRYIVSSLGRVKNKLRPGKIKAVTDNGGGYLVVSLGRELKRYVHRLVATAFVDNPNSYSEVNHIDGNKKNNDISNLEWVTRKQNLDHAKRVLNTVPLGEELHAAILTDELVREYRLRYEMGETLASLHRECPVSKPTLWKAINRRTWKHV